MPIQKRECVVTDCVTNYNMQNSLRQTAEGPNPMQRMDNSVDAGAENVHDTELVSHENLQEQKTVTVTV